MVVKRTCIGLAAGQPVDSDPGINISSCATWSKSCGLSVTQVPHL